MAYVIYKNLLLFFLFLNPESYTEHCFRAGIRHEGDAYVRAVLFANTVPKHSDQCSPGSEKVDQKKAYNQRGQFCPQDLAGCAIAFLSPSALMSMLHDNCQNEQMRLMMGHGATLPCLLSESTTRGFGI